MSFWEDAVALSDSRARGHVVVLAYVIAFAVATICHLFDIARGGWLPYTKYALGLNVFWTSLTFLDPLAIALLLYRRRAGLCLALLIITVDVAVNLTVGIGEFIQSGRFTFWGLATQIPVGVFMWWTAPSVWADAADGAYPSRDG
jgi:hypothetical protein